MRAPPIRTMVVSIAVASLVSVAHAQTGGGMDRLSFGIGGGVAVPANGVLGGFKTGFTVQGLVRLNLKQLRIAPRVDFTYSRFQGRQQDINDPTKVGKMIAGVANVQCFVTPVVPVRPYVVAGLGGCLLEGIGSTTDTRFCFNGGAGVIVKLGGLVSGYVEGRLVSVSFESKSDPVMVFPLTFGVVF